MSTFQILDQNQPKIIIDNEDPTSSCSTYYTFEKLLLKSGLVAQGSSVNQLKCKKVPTAYTITNKFKKIDIQYTLYQGTYHIQFQDQKFKMLVQRGDVKLTTECRQIQYLKRIVIFGQTLDKVKKFVTFIFDLGNDQSTNDNIMVYENNNGNWMVSKEKKPRKMESVIFKQDFIQSVLDDVNDFIDSEGWYTQMGIPYKRSYLLYGPPGTGKSSFAQALAAEIKHSICFVNCSDKINDFNFNRLLNLAPKKSIILIEDVDAIFSQRKNTEKVNALTFSGFLNAIDGVRSQEGRIIVMTTNYKQRLDPALLRPGRVDESYEINYASRYQIQKMCYRFYKNEQIAKEFAQALPQNKFSMSMIQGILLKFRKCPQKLPTSIQDILNSDQNVKIDVFLREINCLQSLNDFRMQQIYSLAQVKNLPKDDLDKIASKLSPLLKGRLIETVRMDRKNYIKNQESLFKFIQESVQDQQKQRKLREFVRNQNVRTLFLIRDQLKNIQNQEKSVNQIKE